MDYVEDRIVPDVLFHYTSIENLALILKNRTIRLNSLDKMDDHQEQRSVEGNAFGRSIFVSSWTDEAEESIPMWKMYTPAFSGVRISLPPMPFSRCGTKDKRYLQAFAPEELKNTLDTIGDSFLDIEKMCSMNVYSAEAFAGNILEKVIYTTDQGKLEPQVLNATDSRYDFAFNLLGRYKNTHWKFQKEWRYRMCFFSAEYDMPNLKMKNVTQNEIEDYVRGGLTPPFSYYDLGIHPEYFSKMTITPSPQMSEGNRVLLDCLVEKYNPSARIIKSSLIGLI